MPPKLDIHAPHNNVQMDTHHVGDSWSDDHLGEKLTASSTFDTVSTLFKHIYIYIYIYNSPYVCIFVYLF